MNKLFPTQDIGSLAKPKWRVKGCKGQPLSREEIADATSWGEKLGVENLDALSELLSGGDSSTRRRAILEWSARYCIRFLEAAGLDVIFDGEQWRSEMYEHVIRNTAGFEFLGYVKSFDYRYFNKAACIGRPRCLRSFYSDEFVFTRGNTEKEVKVPFTGPYTLVDWTFNEYFEKRRAGDLRDFKRRKFEARKDFLFEMIKEVIRPEISRLVNFGARWIQIDEPAATTNPTDEEMELFVEAFNETVNSFNCVFSLHNCYSNYEVLAKYVGELRNCNQLALEFADRDGKQAGTARARRGYKDLKLFEERGFRGNYGLGVIDVHTDFVEPPELVRDRILHVAKLIGDPSRICACTDCGLRTRTWEISFQKLKNMVLGAKLAGRALE